MSEELRALSQIISQGIESIQLAYTNSGQAFPSLDDAAAQDAIADPMVMATTTEVIAAATQLIAT